MTTRRRAGAGAVSLGMGLWLCLPVVAAAGDGVPVTTITTIRLAATPEGPINDGARDIYYGADDDVQMTQATVGGLTLSRSSVSKPTIAIHRRDNANVTGERQTLFYPGTRTGNNNTPTRVDIAGSRSMSMEVAMNNDFITSGGLDVFLNEVAGSEQPNNIERVDFVVPTGINLPSTPSLLNEIGTIANEKNGNNTYLIAMITAVDGAGQPSAFGPLREIERNVDYGNVGRPRDSAGGTLRNIYMRNSTAPTGGTPLNGPMVYGGSDTNFIGMSFLSFAALGASPGQTVYGYSLFGNDVVDTMDLVGLTDVPRNTGGRTNGGDIYGGTFAVFTTPAAEATVSEDLADLSGSKSVAPVIADDFLIPGRDVFYDISVSNAGAGPTSADTIFLVDSLPSELIFLNGDADGAGPGTDPVLFTDNGSGLAFDYATDVGYSDVAAAPAQFSDCSYVPATGYDPAIKHVCIRPSGALSGANGANPTGFSVRFRARIR